MFRCLLKEFEVSFKLKIQKRRYLGLHSPPVLKHLEQEQRKIKKLEIKQEISETTLVSPNRPVKKTDMNGMQNVIVDLLKLTVYVMFI